MVTGLRVLSGERVTHVVPPSMEYWTLVSGLPPSEPTMNDTLTAPVSRATVAMAGAAGTVRGTPLTTVDAGLGPQR